MESTLSYITSLLYLLSAILIWLLMMSSRAAKTLQILVWIFWLSAIILHSYQLSPILKESYSVNLSIDYALILVAFIISITLYISSILGNTQFLGIIILPIVSFIFLLSFENNPVNVSLNNYIFIHVILSLISYSILGLSAAQSLIVKLLSASLISGLIFIEDLFAQHLAHKTVLSILAWFIFIFLILGRKIYGWRGRNAANINLIGFFFLFLSYFGTKTVLELIL